MCGSKLKHFKNEKELLSAVLFSQGVTTAVNFACLIQEFFYGTTINNHFYTKISALYNRFRELVVN